MSARPAKDAATVPPEIQTRLEAAGLRRTLATRAVLGLFLANPQGTLSHAQALASRTAFTAMSSMGELGTVMQFLG